MAFCFTRIRSVGSLFKVLLKVTFITIAKTEPTSFPPPCFMHPPPPEPYSSYGRGDPRGGTPPSFHGGQAARLGRGGREQYVLVSGKPQLTRL
jgi:hypothetical protein